MPDWMYGLGFFLLVFGLMVGGAALQERRNRDTFKWNGKDVRKL